MSNPKNAAAVALGRMGKGKAKTCSDEERERRSLWMKGLNSGRTRRFLEKKKKEAEAKEAVKSRAEVGIFTPIQPYE